MLYFVQNSALSKPDWKHLLVADWRNNWHVFFVFIMFCMFSFVIYWHTFSLLFVLCTLPCRYMWWPCRSLLTCPIPVPAGDSGAGGLHERAVPLVYRRHQSRRGHPQTRLRTARGLRHPGTRLRWVVTSQWRVGDVRVADGGDSRDFEWSCRLQWAGPWCGDYERSAKHGAKFFLT